mgnify:CR=1 FL=1
MMKHHGTKAIASAVPPKLAINDPLIMHYHALLRITVQVSVSVYLMSSHRSSCPLKSIQNVPAAVSHQPTAL